MIGAEFMPHLDEGAIWIRATMPYTISFEEASKLGPQLRALLLEFPQVTTVANELGRPDDGTDPIGFFNDEYFVGLKPYSDPTWHGAIRTKQQLTSAINEKLEAFPGIIFNFTQPAEDAVDEAETGLKSSLAVKIFGSDLETLEAKAEAVRKVIAAVPGIVDITLVRELGQPSLTIEPDRAKIAQYGLNVADINTLIETAVGGSPATKVIQGERSFDLVVRLQEPFRQNMDAIKNLLDHDTRRSAPAAQPVRRHQDQQRRVVHLSREQFALRRNPVQRRGARPRERGAGGTEEGGGRGAPADRVHVRLGRRYKLYLAARSQMAVIIPLTMGLILLILFALYGNMKFPLIIIFSVLLTVPVGGLLALKLTGTNFSVSSGFGFVALMGVAVQTSVILYSFINKLRLDGKDIATATHEASLLRLRPIMMTALVACLGLLPAAMSTGIGSDSQKPFAIVIVGGLISRLALSIFLAPVLYALVAREDDVLKV